MSKARSRASSLHSIFGYHHQSPSSLQDHSSVVKLVLDFLNFLTQTQTHLTKDGGEALELVKKVLSGVDYEVRWQPEYGGVIIADPPSVNTEGITRTVRILALDRWETETHNYAEGEPLSSKREQVSVAMHYQIIFETSVAASSCADLWKLYESILAEKMTSAGKKREKPIYSSKLVVKCLSQAVNNIRSSSGESESSPGFENETTPVGGKTGKKNTSWPIVRSVVRHILSTCDLCRDPELLFSLWNADFHLWLTKKQLHYCKKHSLISCPAEVDQLMKMLQVTIIRITDLAEQGYDPSSRENEYELLRNEIDLQLKLHNDQVVNSWTLPMNELSGVLNSDGGPLALVDPFILELSDHSLIEESSAGIVSYRTMANRNLEKWPTMSLPSSGIIRLDVLLSSVEKIKLNKKYYSLILRTVKDVVFHIFLALCNQPNDVGKASILEYVTIEALIPLLRIVRDVSRNFSAEKTSVVESKSSIVLLSWVMVCLVYERLIRDLDGSPNSNAPGFVFKTYKQYGPCLNPSHLQHFILRNKLEEEVALMLAKYLNSNRGSLFSFSDQSVSFNLARGYAQASPYFRNKLNGERTYAQALIDEHWAQVQSKQESVRRINSTISSLKQKRSIAEQNKRGEYSSYSYQYKLYENEIYSLNSQISSQEMYLSEAQKPPERVRQRVPADDGKALEVLFFLYMPSEFKILSHLTCVANLMILPDNYPNSWFDWPEMNGENCSTWQEYYRKSCNYGMERPNTNVGSVFLCFCKPLPTLKSAYSDVMGIYSKTTDVWYPDAGWYDALDLKLAWEGGDYAPDIKNKIYNPFKSPLVSEISKGFTAQFGEKGKVLQQYLDRSFNNTNARGNLGIANQADKPSHLRKSEFLHFSRLRSYPNTQFRALICALREDQLPLQLSVVRTLIRHAVYSLGDIAFENGTPKLAWRTDLEPDFGGIQAFSDTLVNQLNAMREAVANREKLLILGELCAFVDDRTNSQSKLVLLCSEIPFVWAERLDISLYPAEERPLMRFTQCIYYLYSIACFSTACSLEIYAERIIELNLLINELSVFFTEEMVGNYSAKIRAEYYRLQSIRQEVMAKHHQLVAQECAKNPGMLTAMIRKIIESLPQNLSWNRIDKEFISVTCGENLCCFEAVHEGNLYSVNIYNGIVLKNGLPPSRLASDVKNHPLFLRSFKDCDFEVCESSDPAGFKITKRAIAGRYYLFRLRESQLQVREHGEDQFELLDGTKNGISTWGKSLPIRLQKMHSHWYCSKRNMIILRPKLFTDRTIQFIFIWQNSWTCYEVPEHLQNLSLNELINNLSEMDRLYQPKGILDKVVNILSKFEISSCIHTLLTREPNPKVKISLPRYEMQYLLDNFRNVWKFTSLKHGYNEFFLNPTQQVDYTLFGFSQYLVLSNFDCSQTEILVPEGPVSLEGYTTTSPRIKIAGDESYKATRKLCQYSVHHRFGTLNASDVPHRLMLANLYAATSTFLPEPRSKMTGEETAIKLVTLCWTNKSLSEESLAILDCISNLSFRFPTLLLLCEDLKRSSSQFAFLANRTPIVPTLKETALATTEYHYKAKKFPRNIRTILNEQTPRCRNVKEELTTLSTHSIARAPEFSALLEETTKEIVSLLELKTRISREFPLSLPETLNTELGKKFYVDLERSWNTHLQNKFQTLHNEENEIYIILGSLRVHNKHVSNARSIVEKFILEQIHEIPDAIFRIRRLVNLVPSINSHDLLKVAVNPSILWNWNPFLSQHSVDQLHSCILEWLQLCVLEDKLNRAIKYATANNDIHLAEELKVVRNWNVKEHPQWLVFEVEQQIQIKPFQYDVARALIEDSNFSIVQLNMGLGKTRVILPMLILHYLAKNRSDPKNASVIRLHLLSPLFRESFDYLHNCLTASSLGVKLLQMPFCRDVELSLEQACVMKAVVQKSALCGALIVAPEHRASMHLKIIDYELSEQQFDVANVLRELEQIKFMDILDEVDKVLHYKFQLVYACGASLRLPNFQSRTRVLQTLLRVINNSVSVKAFLSSNPSFVIFSTSVEHTDVFVELRLQKRPGFEDFCKMFVNHIMQALHADETLLSYGLSWIYKHPNIDQIIAFVLNEEVSLNGFTTDQAEVLFALRGFLGFGILIHCLTMRHRVEYGTRNNLNDLKKFLAVPFHAADVPSERAEFGHPDCALVYTQLAYYYQGIPESAFLQALDTLLTMGQSAQNSLYSKWFLLSCNRMTELERKSLDEVKKLDLLNTVQIQCAYKHYRKNCEVINFWLEYCIFPDETIQYDSRLVATAWNLCDSNHGLIGFSGTNDNSPLLPLAIKELTPDDFLRATNGMMLELIIKNPIYHDFALLPQASKKVWQLVLDKVLLDNFHALIDAGALMAGISNFEVAKYLMNHVEHASQSEFLGVVFFNVDADQWFVLGTKQQLWPLNRSPIKEQNAIVFFDEMRCRGADMRLKQDARGLLTLGPRMHKDKLMQAAGRMRQLDKNQKLEFLGPSEITQQIRDVNKLSCASQVTSEHALSWVVQNTVQNNENGLFDWAQQGGLFYTTKDNSKLAKLSVDVDVKTLYKNSSIEKLTLLDAVKEAHRKLTITHSSTASLPFLKQIQDRCEMYNSTGVDVKGLDIECERELQQEVEIEKEVEVQLPSQSPVAESPWDWHKILNSTELPTNLQLSSNCIVVSLATMISNIWPNSCLNLINWSQCDVFVTSNFYYTVTAAVRDCKVLSNYLRPLDAMLVFPKYNQVLLLSEFETNEILPVFWKTSREFGPFLVHLSWIPKIQKLPRLVLPINSGIPAVSISSLVAMKLFNGQVNFTKEEQKALRSLLDYECKVTLTPSIVPATMVDELLTLRGNRHLFSMSDLNSVCTRLDVARIRKSYAVIDRKL